MHICISQWRGRRITCSNTTPPAIIKCGIAVQPGLQGLSLHVSLHRTVSLCNFKPAPQTNDSESSTSILSKPCDPIRSNSRSLVLGLETSNPLVGCDWFVLHWRWFGKGSLGKRQSKGSHMLLSTSLCRSQRTDHSCWNAWKRSLSWPITESCLITWPSCTPVISSTHNLSASW